ncbi:hypothetical protein [Streptomyces alkaliphilus]|uniref:hypothetical protein n=1 Tax=Streptomyces alkaliphilus TaxID=1472722 RepID=UPI00117FC886|nr:hypothetical protein [Streptomyces alkaliphilus]MQS09994.1 hypothetical protein [Streptomyces alkaliphilus]
MSTTPRPSRAGRRRLSSAVPVTALAGCLLLTGCGGGPDDPAEPASPENTTADGGPGEGDGEDVPHGYVEGAEETAEQQSRMVLASGAGEPVHVLDLVSEESIPLGEAGEAGATGDGLAPIVGDGRFAHLLEGAAVRVVDSGAWTVDHGDHVHHYRAAAREVGEARATEPVAVHADTAVTAITLADGGALLLDRSAAEDGELAELLRIDDADGPVLPFDGGLLVPVAGPDGAGRVEVRDRAGGPVAAPEAECSDPAAAAVTRRGAVYVCEQGALWFTAGGNGEPEVTALPWPEGTAEEDRPTELRHRNDGAVLAARAGDRGVWVLDLTDPVWRLWETGPAVAVNAVGENAPVLFVDPAGELVSVDPASGEELARTALLEPAADGSVPAETVIEVDTQRVYVNDIAERRIHEIDARDDLRVARVLPVEAEPRRMVVTGR